MDDDVPLSLGDLIRVGITVGFPAVGFAGSGDPVMGWRGASFYFAGYAGEGLIVLRARSDTQFFVLSGRAKIILRRAREWEYLLKVPSNQDRSISVGRVIAEWWRDHRARHTPLVTTRDFVQKLWDFARASSPEQRRRRFGDLDFDFDHRVNTTGGTVTWRDRLLGTFTSEYQATDARLFNEILNAVPIEFAAFTFIDLGSGKGRTLLMAADYPFRRIIGVELLPTLHHMAEENVRTYKSSSRQCFGIETICADAADFAFPDEPLIVYLFNPFLESLLEKVVARLERSVVAHPRAVCILYHNPLLHEVFTRAEIFEKLGGTHQYWIFANEQFRNIAHR